MWFETDLGYAHIAIPNVTAEYYTSKQAEANTRIV